ncbi:hypothetical protein H6A11_08760, partial [Bifidobacterium pullorum subsp. saeculare]|uniref:hypothetical protein n=1 Tax=Bifidobacterium pullorum TaxID=78448 RepID=UPI00195E92FC
VLLGVGGVAYYAVNHVPAKPPVSDENLAGEVNQPAHDEGPSASLASTADGEFASSVSPTKGKPIELQYVPFGSEIIINVHPAELWKDEE